MTFLKKIRSSWKKILRRFHNRKFSKSVDLERSKKFLYQNETPSLPWIQIYQKARRGAYFRPIYSTFTKNKRNFQISFALLWILLIGSSVYIVALSPYFQISPNRVIIERDDAYSDINIAYKAIEPIYGDSLWFVSQQHVTDLIRGLEKNIEQVKVSHLLPNSLKIIIKSSAPAYTVDFPWVGRNYLISENGILIPNRAKKSDLPRLQIYSTTLIESSFLDYKEAVPPRTMKKIRDVYGIFGTDFKGSIITSMTLYEVENELHILLENGTRIILVLDTSLEKQLLSLKLTNEQTPGLLISPDYTYIDARIVGKIFMCKDPNLCNRNLLKIYGNPPY